MKKTQTKVTNAKNNGGMHRAREFQKAREILEGNRYQEARLYHLSFKGSEQVAPYQEAMKALCAELRRHGSPCQWRACIEAEEEKGLHWHAYILVEGKFYNPDHIINRKSDGWLTTMLAKKGLKFDLNPPRDPVHLNADGTQNNYARLPKSKPEKIANCVEWISYLYKVRSKFVRRPIYFSSRPTKEKLHPVSKVEAEAGAGVGVGARAGAGAGACASA